MRLRAPLLVACGLLVLAAPARANFTGSATDPAGDVADGRSGRDLTALGVGYDRNTGSVKLAIALANEPVITEDGVGVKVLVAHRSPAGCDQTPALLAFGQTQASGPVQWALQTGPAGAPLGASGEADNLDSFHAVQRYEIDDAALRDRAFDCVTVSTTDPADPNAIIDSVGPVALAAQPELRLRVSGIPKAIVRTRTRRITVRVENPGDAPATGVKLRIARTAGLKAPQSTSLGTIAAGKTVTRKVRIGVTARAKSRVDLKLTATSGKLSATGAYVIAARSRSQGAGGGSQGTVTLCNVFSPDLSGQSGGSLILVPCPT